MLASVTKFLVLSAALLGAAGGAAAATTWQVTFNLSAPLQNVFVADKEFNGAVNAWALFPVPLGTVPAGTSTFDLGAHNGVVSFGLFANYGASGVATGINDSISPPVGKPFNTVFTALDETYIASNIATLWGGAFNTQSAYTLFDFVLTNEDVLGTDTPSASVDVYTFSNAVKIGTATFGPAPTTWFDLGSGHAGSSGTPLLAGTGSLGPASSDQLDLTAAKGSAAATLVFGAGTLNAPFKGGTLVPAPLMLVPFTTSAAGKASLPFVLPAGIPAGTALYFQFWVHDAGASMGFSASNGLKGLTH